jgi:hypothetical protein
MKSIYFYSRYVMTRVVDMLIEEGMPSLSGVAYRWMCDELKSDLLEIDMILLLNNGKALECRT